MSDQPSSRPLPITQPGEGGEVRIRLAQMSDAAAIARVFVDCWKEGYHGILPTAYAAGLSYEDQAEAWRRMIRMPGNASFVAVSRQSEVLAFLSGGPERSGRSSFFAEIYGLYVLPEHRGHGVGRLLLQSFCQRLLGIGLRTLTVRVLEANPIRSFYEAMGAVEQDASPVRVAGRSLYEVAYGWRDILPLSQGTSTGNAR